MTRTVKGAILTDPDQGSLILKMLEPDKPKRKQITQGIHNNGSDHSVINSRGEIPSDGVSPLHGEMVPKTAQSHIEI